VWYFKLVSLIGPFLGYLFLGNNPVFSKVHGFVMLLIQMKV
jgi:hypothetical protein